MTAMSNSKKLLALVISLAICFWVVWMVFSAIFWNFNPAEWHIVGRIFATVACSCILSMIAKHIFFEEEDNG
jgi:uncharacterized protein YggT (Ycf19 family)